MGCRQVNDVSNKPRGTPRVYDRRFLNGNFWVLLRSTMARSAAELRRHGKRLRVLPVLEKGEVCASALRSWERGTSGRGRIHCAIELPPHFDAVALENLIGAGSRRSRIKEIAGAAAPLGCHPPMDKEHHRATRKSREKTRRRLNTTPSQAGRGEAYPELRPRGQRRPIIKKKSPARPAARLLPANG
jgi:hypothetical protein